LRQVWTSTGRVTRRGGERREEEEEEEV